MNEPTPSPDPRKVLERAADELRASTAPRDAALGLPNLGLPNLGLPSLGLPSFGELASRFDAFELESTIGRGGMGVVFRAHHHRLNRAVAVKILPRQLHDDPSFAARFEREGQTLAQLDHPNVLRVLDHGERGGFYYLVTELVDGLDLRQLLTLGRVSVDEVLRIVPQVCAGLAYAHSQGIIHRDVKPEKIVVDQEGNVTIVDFGLAKLVGGEVDAVTLTSAAAAVGTPHYMAPEQLQTPAVVDQRADVFSLGVVFYELLTGRLPMGRFEPPSARAGVSSALATALDRVVMKSLAESPDDRYPSADALLQDLARAEHAEPAHRRRRKRARAARHRAHGGDRPHRNSLPTGAILAAGAVLFVGANLGAVAGGPNGWLLVLLLLAGVLIAIGSIFGIIEVRRIARGQASVRRAIPATVYAWAPCLLLGEFAVLMLNRPFTGGDVAIALCAFIIADVALLAFLAEWLRRVAPARRAEEQAR